ncbi:MAG: 3-hydroxybutyryl-CoA dehydrogenase, partial [Candidatus Binatota bacterium]|nr:3-hydroxybutyryl-CoA dehydrogenase [Candidatus Binatota bacterium]
MIDAIKSVGVLGLGVMGFDIAFLYAQKGYRTLVYDAAEAAMKNLTARRDQTIERLKRRNRISEIEVENVKHGLIAVPGLAAMASADLATEAVSESGKTKKSVYQALRDNGFGGILTTNTSSLIRSSLVDDGDYARERFATTHFFNPVLYTQMVEVVKGDMNDGSFATLTGFLDDLGRKPVETKDISGFVSNSVLMVYAVMALRLIESGATIEAVDGAAKELRALPPCLSYDSWKPSIVEDVTRVMHEFRGDSYLRSSKLLAALAKDNPLFYVDQKPNPAIYNLFERTGRSPDQALIKLALLTSVRVAAARTVELGETPVTVDFIATDGLKFPRGPLGEIDDLGADSVLKDLRAVNKAMPANELQAPALLTAMADA